MSRFSFARAFDSFLYKRLKDGGLALDLYEASALGAVLSLAGSALVAVLVLSELLAYLSHGIRQEVFVAPASSDLLRLSFNITFPRLPCNQVDLEVGAPCVEGCRCGAPFTARSSPGWGCASPPPAARDPRVPRGRWRTRSACTCTT